VGLAEELAQDALVTALEQWPQTGVPDNPGAWLMTTAKHRAIDRLRRHQLMERKHEEIARELEAEQADAMPRFDAMLDDDIGDDLLRLIFTACHPALPAESRVALPLRLLGVLSTVEIVRAKRTMDEKQEPFEVPRGEELAERLDAVLGVIYLVFNEGYTATAGDDS